MKRVNIKLNLHNMSVAQLIEYANHIVACMTSNANFTTPHPPLAQITTAVNALIAAQNAALSGGATQTSIMHEKRDALIALLDLLGSYVGTVANDPSVSDEGRGTIVLSAGMDIAHHYVHGQHVFGAKHGPQSGTVALAAAGLKHGTHEWQYATEPPAANAWNEIPATTKASTVVHDLQPGNKYSFRHRTVTTEGQSDWEGPVTLIVV